MVEIGNFMNTGGRLKNAVGYDLASLLKTSESKSPYKRGFTLLAYIVQFTRELDDWRVDNLVGIRNTFSLLTTKNKPEYK